MLTVQNVFHLLIVCGGIAFIQGFSLLPLSPSRRCHEQCSSLNLFGGLNYEAVESFLDKALFSYDDDDKQQKNNDDPHKEFVAFTDLEEEKCCDNPSDMKQLESARESLLHFLQLWARQLQDDPKAQGLTTPVMVQDFRRINATAATGNNGTEPMTTQTDYYHSMKLIFRPPKRYLSYKEQRGMEKGVLPDRKGAKVDAWSPGGVELMVGMNIVDNNNGISETLSNQDNLWRLQLVARRCDIDGDTIIKYESERAILRRLQEAIRIWRKVRAMK